MLKQFFSVMYIPFKLCYLFLNVFVHIYIYLLVTIKKFQGPPFVDKTCTNRPTLIRKSSKNDFKSLLNELLPITPLSPSSILLTKISFIWMYLFDTQSKVAVTDLQLQWICCRLQKSRLQVGIATTWLALLTWWHSTPISLDHSQQFVVVLAPPICETRPPMAGLQLSIDGKVL